MRGRTCFNGGANGDSHPVPAVPISSASTRDLELFLCPNLDIKVRMITKNQEKGPRITRINTNNEEES
jgi:hypothetical protein